MRARLVMLIASLPLAAQGQAGEQARALVGGTLVDVATGELTSDALVIWNGERIAYAGPAGGRMPPQGARVIDARGKFLLPGLADMHNHLAAGTYRLTQSTPEHEANLRCMLQWGFTTIYSPGLPFDWFAKLQAASRADTRAYPNLRATGPPITAPGGHGAHGALTPTTPAAAREAVRKLKDAGADAIKIVYSDLTYVTTRPRPMLEREVMAAVIDEAHRQGLEAYVHAPILRYAKEALRAGADGMAHGIVSEPIDAEFIALMKKNGVFYMPTLSIFHSAADMQAWAERMSSFDAAHRVPQAEHEVGLDPHVQEKWNARWDNLDWLRRHLAVLRDNARAVMDAGIPVLMGSDTSESGTGTFLGLTSQMELQLMVEAGLTPLEALQTATVNAARMLGREADLGTLAAGKLADILVIDANPVADIGNVRRVFRVVKAGRIYDPTEPNACVAQPPATTVIQGATLIDGTGRPPLADGAIEIREGRIVAVGPRAALRIPPHAQVIDAAGKFVVPGLADMHNHLGDGTFHLAQPPADYRRNLARMLGWGYTLVYEHGLSDLELQAELKRVAAHDTAAYPRFFGAGSAFRAKDGHGVLRGTLTPATPDEARRQVRELQDAGVDSVKIMHTDLRYVTTQRRPTIDPAIMAAIIDEAHRQGLKAYVHAPVLDMAKEALRAGADGLVHGILSDPVDDEFIGLMRANRATYITTHAIFEAVADRQAWARRALAYDTRALVPHSVYAAGLDAAVARHWSARWDNLAYTQQRLPVLRANARKVWDAGILVVAGSDSGNSGAGTLLGLAAQLELQLLVESGLTTRQALQAATLNAARMIGREADLGSIEPGKRADLVILDADPLQDIRNVYRVHRVMRGGVLHDPKELL